ncbi:anillin, actin binding protein 2 isoform X2 [Halichoeres trimaculatus]|uniref:anillin, actin binding protein 2 isoform X2 n=1 Tax=Halichoeres trimaculatus TaxID=147232 RepID=UPI003D9F14D2
MEAGEENGGNTSLKRQRIPLSDSEDNVFAQSEENDGQKRRRLEASGQENRSPKPSTSGRRVELETKPDTPMVPSVRSRVHLLTQRQEGVAPLAQRCLSDPGAAGSSLIIQEKGFRENLLGEGEFSQRMERFKVPVFEVSPAPAQSSANPCPRTCSNFVSDIQHKLQGATTPSSKQAVRMRQEREKELSQLQFQPISENAWLKRSSSDPSLSQGRTPSPGPSYPSCWVPRSIRGVCWPPIKPWDAADNGEVKDDSFTGATTSSAKKQTQDGTGKTPCCDSDVPDSSAEPGDPSEQLKVKQEEQSEHQGKEFEEGIDYMASFGSENHPRPQKPQTQTVLMLSFSEDQSFSSMPLCEEQNVSELPTGEDQSLLECTSVEEFNIMKAGRGSGADKKVRSEGISVEETEEKNCSAHHEERMETSTDEEQRLWRYPSECEEESVLAQQQAGGEVCAKEEEAMLDSSEVEEQSGGSAADHRELSDLLYGECERSENVSAEIANTSEMMEDEEPERDKLGSERMVSSAGCSENRGDIFTTVQDENSPGASSDEDDESQVQKETQTVGVDEESDRRNLKPSQSMRKVQMSDVCLEKEETEQAVTDERQGDVEDTQEREEGDSSKKVSFILEHELISDPAPSDTNASLESRIERRVSDSESSSHDETNTADIIDQMFEEVLEYAGRIEEERGNHEDIEDHDSGIGPCSRDKFHMDVRSGKEKSEAKEEVKAEEDGGESKMLENDEDDMLTFPPSAILSPLSKSVEAVVTPLRIVEAQESNPPSLPLTPEENLTPPAESALLYSIDAYRTQSQSKPSTIQSITPEVQRQAPEKSRPPLSDFNFKQKMKDLNEEAGKLQTVISQTLQALSCCTDEEHGQGSLVEAEAEKLLLVSCEKRSALLAEMARLREERNAQSGKAAGEENYSSQQPCRGTVSITNIQLPLKVEYVCSSLNRSGRPSHYFFLLIRYGPCNIVATPLATAADAKKGDTISFPTSVTLKDIRSTFEIDVEVYSLSNNPGNNCTMDRTTTKSRVTPRKLLNTITRSSNSLTTAALPPLSTRRSSNFSLVGSHKISLASLGHSKFPLDKVPFLSPLEGNIYLQLESESHSNVQHQGFLTMFELISGFGVWHRRYFVLEGCDMYYWNHPNDRETKGAEGSISLSSSHSQCVRPVERDSCARPFTFELVRNPPHQQQQENGPPAKCWFSADTKQERSDWMEKLNQALLDFHTWSRTTAESQQLNESSSGNLRESIL